jgi:hypothetical protein
MKKSLQNLLALIFTLSILLSACGPTATDLETSMKDSVQREEYYNAYVNTIDIDQVDTVNVCYNSSSNATVSFEAANKHIDVFDLNQKGFTVIGENLIVKDNNGIIVNLPNEIISGVVVFHTPGDTVEQAGNSNLPVNPTNKIQIQVITNQYVITKDTGLSREGYLKSYHILPTSDTCYSITQ